MSFLDVCRRPAGLPLGLLAEAGEADVLRALDKERPDERDFAALLSPAAVPLLERLAAKAAGLTLGHFGRTISLYAPLYLANHCENECVYCGFRRSAGLKRARLGPAGLEREARALAATGIRHVLMLTGESQAETPLRYLTGCAAALRRHFSSVSAEVYPLDTEGYAALLRAGADGLALYQETYDEELYLRLHRAGPKRDYAWRLDAPERACRAGLRAVSVGALLGLGDLRRDVFFTGLHAAYLQRRYPGVELGVSLPRLRPQGGGYRPAGAADDRSLVQAMTALRLFLPGAAISVSTRETAELRGNLIGLGVTRMSAGSRTGVGGYAGTAKSGGQFGVADRGSVADVKAMIIARGWQPVMKDWQAL